MEEGKRKVTIRTWEEKKSLCEQWKASGKTKSKFCKENNIPLATFFPWCNTLWPESREEERDVIPVKIVHKVPLSVESAEQIELEIMLAVSTSLRFKLPMKDLVPFIQELSHAVATLR